MAQNSTITQHLRRSEELLDQAEGMYVTSSTSAQMQANLLYAAHVRILLVQAYQG